MSHIAARRWDRAARLDQAAAYSACRRRRMAINGFHEIKYDGYPGSAAHEHLVREIFRRVRELEKTE
jgi:hypothetical protein